MTSTRIAIVSLLTALSWLVSTEPARADYRDSYCQGVEASRRNRWAEVAQRMQDAIKERPQEGGLVRCSYLNQVTYVPHYYLGRALREQGDCRAAVVQWDLSESQGVVKTLNREYADLVDGKRRCGPPTTVIAAAPPPARGAPPAPALTPVEPPPAPPVVSRPAAESVAAAPTVPTTPPRERAEAPAATPPPTIEPPIPVASPIGIPDVLRRAAQAYFDGDYQATVRLLSAPPASNERPIIRAQRQLFMAASKYALYQIGGGSDRELRRDAEAAVKAAREVNGSVALPVRYFSPGFTQFFRSLQ